MGKRKKVKGSSLLSTQKIKLNTQPLLTISTQQMRPKFSLEFLQTGYCIPSCEKGHKVALIDRLHELSQLTWNEIMNSHRHKQGCEIIKHHAIKAPIPGCIPKDVNLLAFRFDGKKPMVGFRDREVLFIVWLDLKYTVYNHS